MNDFAAGALLSSSVAGVLAAGAMSLRRWRTRGDAGVRMLARQYQAMTASAERDVAIEEVAAPELISSRMEFRKIEAIEVELVNASDGPVAQKLLKAFLNGGDPWVRARAAKALYPLDSKEALHVLQTLVQDPSSYVQMPGIWALGELGTPRALEILMPMAESPHPEIQETVIRCLVQMESKQRIPSASLEKVKRLLKELRFKADWIL